MKPRAHIPFLLVGIMAVALALSACGGGDDEENGGPVLSDLDITPSLEGWSPYTNADGDVTGITNAAFGLSAWIDTIGHDQIRHLDSARAPAVAGTWSGEWGGVVGDAIHQGDARIAVTLNPDSRSQPATAVVHLDDFPHWGDFVSAPLGVDRGGSFSEYFHAHDETRADDQIVSKIVGQFGGPDAAGVVGLFRGRHYDADLDFDTAFYGENP